MAKAGVIFEGTTISPAREYVARVATSGTFPAYYFPCAGRFAAITAAVKSGVPKDRIFCSDISLFSSIIGYLSDPERQFEDLGIAIGDLAKPFVEDAKDVYHLAAGVMVAIKYLQIEGKTQYNMNLRRELKSSRGALREKLAEDLKTATDLLKGIHYAIVDVRDELYGIGQAEGGFAYVNLPGYAGGYSKMFAGIKEHLRWEAPALSDFEPKEAAVLLDQLTGKPALCLAYRRDLADLPNGWEPVFANDSGKGRVDYIATNQPGHVSVQAVAKFSAKPGKEYPIYHDEDITPDSKVQIVQTDKDTALMYRDLFVHRLGTTVSEQYYLMLIDGRVTTAFGLACPEVMHGKHCYVKETFGITRTSQKYARLGKLFMLCLTSGDMKRLLMKQKMFHLREPCGIQTTSITEHHEGKTDRSVMKLVFREPLQPAGFRLIYRAEWREDGWGDCLKMWLERWGSKRRPGKNQNGPGALPEGVA